ncbi:hypothetical protein TNCT_508341 [Trichonephila clavata]|uniref:Uncharacterized protein n=1 Tax=Trichonephila clavata TaxID=2740835 RepID=A0A8X6FNU8_TRICU|nr:hypothetical protein TNCT_508341 [Trichonephila clavata]
MTRPSSHGGGWRSIRPPREMTLTVLWNDSGHSYGPTDLAFICTRDGPPIRPVTAGVGERFIPKRNDIHRAVEGFRTQFWTH